MSGLTKRDWKLIAEELNRDESGGPPTADEVIALYEERLSDEAADRVRRQLADYPEMALAMETPFPEDDDGSLTPDEIDASWKRIQTRIAQSQGSAKGACASSGVSGACGVNAVIVALCAILLAVAIFERGRIASLQRVARTPLVGLEMQTLMPGPMRCRTAYTPLDPTPAPSYLLELPILPEPPFPDYRLDIWNVSAIPRKVWSSGGLYRAEGDDVFTPLIPKTILRGPAPQSASAERYQLKVFGQGDGAPIELATYYVSVSEAGSGGGASPCHGSAL